jgi:DNA transformation protein
MSADFVAHVLDLMSGWGGVSARRMFSGYGIYRQNVMFALISRDALYFKVDGRSRPDFEAAGSKPFIYSRDGKGVSLSYFEAPPELFDEPDEMVRWAQKALDAAIAAKTRKPGKKKRRA